MVAVDESHRSPLPMDGALVLWRYPITATPLLHRSSVSVCEVVHWFILVNMPFPADLRVLHVHCMPHTTMLGRPCAMYGMGADAHAQR